MSDNDPLVRLPDEVVLTRDEIARTPFALDVIETVDLAPADAARVRDAVQLLTSKLWPDLGDLVDGDG